MREFILLARKVPTVAHQLYKGSTEVGLVIRSILNTFWLSHLLRRDTVIHISINGPPIPPLLLTINGAEIERFTLEEDDLMDLLRQALNQAKSLLGMEEKSVVPGVVISKKPLETLLKEIAERTSDNSAHPLSSTSSTSKKTIIRKPTLLYLEKKGTDIRDIKFAHDTTFIFGDVFGLPKNTERLLKRLGAQKVSLGPAMILASHCPVLVHNELDRQKR